ncbi:spore germination protein [Thermaerobacter marianensis DSM 12885]|uniref:Spore germination protein n=1 Tax=Thermaerobacter marianensis (strain ATCC 700841 / DSM 12885 / JCM 10246 / 7p75a) TaxID=644966 RepID=E6SKK7_THEM7|nr:endospore germination permease [Thermaerobacter marianensis]ADU50194.1 spore germination protein [Thermaerobacter marianensis DSM 12885]
MVPFDPRREQISAWQLFVLLFFTISPTAILTLSALIGRYAGHDAWLSIILATGLGVAVAWLHLALARRFPGQGWTDIHRLVLGRWLGTGLNLLVWVWILQTAGVIVREFGEFVVATVLPLTPLVVIHGSAMLLVMWAARAGIEVLARVGELLLPLIVISLLFVLVLLIPNADWRSALPVLESGWTNLVRGGLPLVAWLGETVLALVILPSLAQWQGAGRAAVMAVLAVGGLLALLTLGTILVLGDTAPLFTFPPFAATRTVTVANFLERLEPVITAVWVGGLVVKMGIWLYAATVTGAAVFGIEDYRPLVTPMAALMLALSLWLFDDSLEMTDYLARTWPFYALFFQVVVPAVVTLAAMIRGLPVRGRGRPPPEPQGTGSGTAGEGPGAQAQP